MEEGALFVRDLQSTNGTYVNGVRIAELTEVHQDDLIQFADMPFRLGCESRKSDSRTMQENVYDRALGFVQFDKLLNERALVSYFQPIVELRDSQTIAYEILSRSRLVGLETPAAMFYTAAAAQYGTRAEPAHANRGCPHECHFSGSPTDFPQYASG